jgi:glucose-6-phosphate 1-dehydrogenase
MPEAPEIKPSILVIFGITGDLAKRKVLPALYHLCKDRLLPEGTKVIGISRRDVPLEEILDTVNLCVMEKDNICDPEVISRLRSWVSMFKLDPLSDDDYEHLKRHLNDLEQAAKQCMDRLFYLSIPPQVYSPIIQKMGQHGLNASCDHNQAKVRLMIEKPFGHDVTSAEFLVNETEKVFTEEQIFRIDHYLAKETAQNILRFRRHNPVFSSQWNSRHIRRIHVMAKEKIGIENRINFYEQVGAMRDLIQSHLMQLLSLTAMHLPAELNSEDIHAAKHAFMQSLIPPGTEGKSISNQVVRGQYDSYREEVANPHSSTETFVSLLLKSSDPDWEGTTFQLTTGKYLDEKLTQIQVQFGDRDPNILSLRIQPDEGIDINLLIEQPGFTHNLRQVRLNFSYSQDFDTINHDAYERVLVDAIRGERLLFATKMEVLTSWHLLQPIINSWQNQSDDLKFYAAGSRGPSILKLNRQEF